MRLYRRCIGGGGSHRVAARRYVYEQKWASGSQLYRPRVVPLALELDRDRVLLRHRSVRCELDLQPEVLGSCEQLLAFSWALAAADVLRFADLHDAHDHRRLSRKNLSRDAEVQ